MRKLSGAMNTKETPFLFGHCLAGGAEKGDDVLAVV